MAIRTLRKSAVVTSAAIASLSLLSAFFAVVGLTLAAVGLYGVMSYSVVRRTREIGIRLALGAPQLGVLRTVLGGVAHAAAIGAAGGLAGGWYLSRFVKTLVFEVTPLEPWTLALPLGALLAVAALAVVPPALRATRVDPAVTLRAE
jgi:ABC-type antimicrobial peptide transport system permease subunit